VKKWLLDHERKVKKANQKQKESAPEEGEEEKEAEGVCDKGEGEAEVCDNDESGEVVRACPPTQANNDDTN